VKREKEAESSAAAFEENNQLHIDRYISVTDCLRGVVSSSCVSDGGGFFELRRVHSSPFLSAMAKDERVSDLRAFWEPESGSRWVPGTAASAIQEKKTISNPYTTLDPNHVGLESTWGVRPSTETTRSVE